MSGSNLSDLIGKSPDRHKLIAVVYADMVGYSRLIGLDDVGTLDRLRTLRGELIDPAVDEHGGRIVQTGGDSLLIVFDSIEGAVRCAVKVQEQVPIHDGDQPPEGAIRFRIGINIGDAIADGTDLHGDAVNVAAMLQAECPPGGICVTRAVRDHVHNRLNLTFEELGPLNLKNIARPVEAFLLRRDREMARTEPIAASMPLVSIEKAPRVSLVVLPFRNLSDISDEDYLADTLTNELTIELARIPSVLVIAHTSAATSEDQPIDVRRVGEALGVRYAVEGVVRKFGETLRVSVRLILTANNQLIWADRFDGKIEDSAVDQDNIVRRIGSILDLRILDAETAISVRERPDNPDANDLLFRAWSLYYKPASPEILKRTTELLERAVQLDPSLVPAMWSLADRLIYRYARPGTSDWGNDDLIDRAADLLSNAEKIEPNDEWLLFVQCSLLRACGHWSEARQGFQHLVMIYPNNFAAHRMLGRCKMIMGQPGEAISSLQSSIHLDTLSHFNRFVYPMIGTCLLSLGDAAGAIGWLERSLAESPEDDRSGYAHQKLYLASAYALTDQNEKAGRALIEAKRFWPFATVRSLWPFYEPRGLPDPSYAEQMRDVRKGLRLAGLRDSADEASDFGVPSRQSLSLDPVGWTPLECPGATTLRTTELVDLLAKRRPILIDVALGSWGKSIPGAIGLQGTGHGPGFSVKVQTQFKRKMHDLTNGDLSAPIVVFCMNSERFTGYNLASRLVALGYTQVYWYRGGVEAWQASDLPESDLILQDW
ncbi:MAG: adenylate cyclase [Acetobacteraceae bacterium]|nr:adenylate cyclase [Acetobacteraceae bacterium]